MENTIKEVTYHVYDINLLEIYRKLSLIGYNSIASTNHRGLSLHDYRELQLNYLKDFFKKNNIDIEEYKLHNTPIIVNSEHSVYLVALSIKLLIIESYKISLFLDYQSTIYNAKHNKQNNEHTFEQFVKFKLLDYVNNNAWHDPFIVVDEIKKWLEKQSAEASVNSLKGKLKVDNKESANGNEDDKNEPVVTFTDNFKITILPELLNFVHIDDKEKMKDLITKGTTPDDKIKFILYQNRVVEFFKRGLYNDEIVVLDKKILSRYIEKNFRYTGKKNKVPDIDYSTAYEILTKFNKEPNKSDCILTDFLPYIDNKKRKS
jgi:hypothetical protein